MRILDKNNREVESPDLELGYLVGEQILVAHHDAVKGVPAKGHYETVAVYPNGGQDIEWVVDVPGVKAEEARDEYESIERYVLYTEAELAERRIAELKRNLAITDYVVIKIAEGVASAEDYADIIANRQAWREEINSLETE